MIVDYAELVIEATNRIGDGALVKRAGMIASLAEADLGKMLWNYDYIPSLEENGTNWVLEQQPEIYLFAFIKHAYLAQMDAEKAAEADAYLRTLIEAFKSDEKKRRMEGVRFRLIGDTP